MGNYDVFDGATDFYSTVYDGTGIKCPKVDYATRFSELMENYNPHDEVSVEETKSDVSKNFLNYLREESIDPANLEEFLDGETILKYRKFFLSARQYEINRKDLLKKLSRHKMFEHWDELMELRINKDFLVKQYIQELRENPWASDILKGMNFLINEKGIPCLITFLYMKEIILQLSDDDIIECMRKFADCGLSKNVIREFTSGALRVETAFHIDELGDLIDADSFKERLVNEYVAGDADIQYRTIMEHTDDLNSLSEEQRKKLYTCFDFLYELSSEDQDDVEFGAIKTALQYASIDEIVSGVQATLLPRKAKSLIDADCRLAAVIYVNGGKFEGADSLKTVFEDDGEFYSVIALHENIPVSEIHEKLAKELGDHKELIDRLDEVEEIYRKRGDVDKEYSETVIDTFGVSNWVMWFILGCMEYNDYNCI